MTDTLDALERLARLHQSGALTDAEFAEQKAKVLRGGGADRVVRHGVEEDVVEGGVGPGKLLLAALGAVLLGILLWWQLVDSQGELKPVPTPGTVAAAGKVKPVTATETPADSPAVVEQVAAPAAVETAAAPEPATFSPSFDCGGQDQATLVMICESRSLSRKDRDLSDRFKTVLRSLSAEDRKTLLRRQREFLRERSACQDTACLHDWYDRTLEFYS